MTKTLSLLKKKCHKGGGGVRKWQTCVPYYLNYPLRWCSGNLVVKIKSTLLTFSGPLFLGRHAEKPGSNGSWGSEKQKLFPQCHEPEVEEAEDRGSQVLPRSREESPKRPKNLEIFDIIRVFKNVSKILTNLIFFFFVTFQRWLFFSIEVDKPPFLNPILIWAWQLCNWKQCVSFIDILNYYCSLCITWVAKQWNSSRHG